ncbi:MAG TPA: transporter associated domain-containing protein, partial [Nitrolancea sp.]|nr:transporter associated domain-containing protein [Nitrolancea sp.]
VFYVKDLVELVLGADADLASFDIRSVIRPVLTVPASLPIDTLLDEMKAQRTHLVVVVDEYGGTAGMVTLDDIMERVVGEVPDEFDLPGQDILDEQDGSSRVNGLTHLSDIREHFGLELEADETSTIGGFVFAALGQRPAIGDRVVVGPYGIEVTALDGLRIAEVRFTRINQTEELTVDVRLA